VQQRTTELQRLALKLSDAEDVQRRRLAQDIHDSVGQSLTLVKLRLQSAASAPPVERQDGLGETLAVLDNAIQQTRTLTFELYPPMLDDLGLAAALRWLAKELARQSGADVTVIEEGKPPKELSKSLASYLYRSIRELIGNAITHGRASEAIVTIYWRSESVRATVDDNGSGFDPETVTRGLGMAAINRRLSTLGGSMNIESAPGTGSRIILEAPLT